MSYNMKLAGIQHTTNTRTPIPIRNIFFSKLNTKCGFKWFDTFKFHVRILWHSFFKL